MLFQVPSATSGEEPQLAVICALGSEDRSITVWSTLQSKVLAAFKDLFEREILDITWYGIKLRNSSNYLQVMLWLYFTCLQFRWRCNQLNLQ